MLLDRALYERLVTHFRNAVQNSSAEESPFPHVLIKGVFPDEVYRKLIQAYPSVTCFTKANPKHHSNEYGGSTRQRMTLCEESLSQLPDPQHRLWATVRAAISSTHFRNEIFSKLSGGLCRRYRIAPEQLNSIPAFPRGQLYSEIEGFRIAPHPDTRDKIVTMQFAFPEDESLMEVGTEFYSRSLNPLNLLREPRGFVVSRVMPFLPNHAYAFSVLNDVGLKSWHGRSTIPPMNQIRNSLLHIWYADPDETHQELASYQKFIQSSGLFRKVA